MPTLRSWKFLFLALILYLLANQTQIGWVYVLSDGILGLLLVAFFFSWRMLHSIQAERFFHQPTAEEHDLYALSTFHEDDPIEVELRFQHSALRPAFLVQGTEFCPFALPADQEKPFFLPHLFKNQTVTLRYQTECYQRGLYHFTPMRLHSQGPFGFFKSRRTITVPSEILIYPAYHRLRQLRLLESREMAEHQTNRVGLGTQVIGVRDYRPGDSLRYIHWRSTARAGELVVKEFADDDHLSLTVVLDLNKESSLGEGKFSTFETAIRIAASLGDYACRQKIPFHLAGASPQWPPPHRSIGWHTILNYLAKVQNDGETPLPDVLNHLTASSFVIVLVSKPYSDLNRAFSRLQQRGIPFLVIMIHPQGESQQTVSFGKTQIYHLSPDNWTERLEEL